MWHDMFVQQIPLTEKMLRTVIVYALLAVLFRIAGKRGLAGMNTFDFIVIFLLSNVVQNAVIGNDNSLVGGMIGAVTLVAVNAGVTRLTVASPTAERIFEGRSTAVINDGRVNDRALRHLVLRRSELDHAVRLQNGDDVTQVAHGSLEPDGHLLLTLKAAQQTATKTDIAAITDRLRRIEGLLAATPTIPQRGASDES
jgi:uncharacterized membrane protein YcaP (DUF421 family)